MNLSDMIADVIADMLRENQEVEIRRNTLAQSLGCVPSQINYVISSRFTPEKGFLVESKRGGGGCIKITRIPYSGNSLLMHVVAGVGDAMTQKECHTNIVNLIYRGLLTQEQGKLIFSAVSGNAYTVLPPETRDRMRCAVFKQMLLSVMQTG